MTGEREHVQSLERGLAVLRAFGAERPRMTLSEVAGAVGIARATARRFLFTLERLGYVESDGKHFWLKAQTLSLGYAYLSSLPWWQVAQPFMEEVSARLSESCSASVLEGGEIVYVARVAAKRIMSINLSLGSRLPAYATSMGRVLLAELCPAALDAYFRETRLEPLTSRTLVEEPGLRRVLERCRKEGYALVDQELEEGLRSIAVPLRDRSGRAIAALNVSTPAAAVPKADLVRRHLPALRQAASRTSETLAY